MKCKQYIARVNKSAKVFEVSARTGDGIDELAKYLMQNYSEWKEGVK